MLFILEDKMGEKIKQLFKRLKKFRKNSKSNRNIFLVCISIIMIWRGVWSLLDLYVLPNHPILSNLICIIIGVIILLIDDGKLGELEQGGLHKEKL